MAQNNGFESYPHPFFYDYSYFYPPPYQNFPNPYAWQMENPPYCSYYPYWDNQVLPQQSSEAEFDPADEIDQSSTGAKQTEFRQKKVKRSQGPRIRPTKNNESNISNQAFSFVTSQNKSKAILENFFNNRRKAEVFYEYSKNFNSKRKKYMSKSTLLKLCTLTERSPLVEDLLKTKNFVQITLSEFASGVRFLVLYFLKHKSTTSILTSQKIAQNLKRDHIRKVREVRMYIEDNILE